MPPVVLLHHVFAVEHLVADFTGVELLAVLLLVLGEVAVGGEEPRADVTLERLVVWSEGMKRRWLEMRSETRGKKKRGKPTCPAVVEL